MKLRDLPLLAAAVALTIQPVAAAAKETPPLVLSPSSQWVLDYASDSCAMRRVFGEGDQVAQLEMRQFQPRGYLQISVLTNALKTEKRAFKYRFDPAEEWRDEDQPYFAIFGKNFEGVIFDTSIVPWPEGDPLTEQPPEDNPEWRAKETEILKATTGLAITDAFERQLVLQTGPLTAANIALKQCIDELLTHWGIDAAAHRSLKEPAKPKNIRRVSRLMEYPPAMLSKGLSGIVRVRLSIDASGEPTDCHIQLPLSDTAFEQASCARLKRLLRFEPALDANGKAIASYWVTSVKFRMSN